MTRSRVVIFDLDDTLWDLVRTMQRAHQVCSPPSPPTVFYRNSSSSLTRCICSSQEWAADVREVPGGEKLAEANPDWRSWTDASKVFAEIKRDRPDLPVVLPGQGPYAHPARSDAPGVCFSCAGPGSFRRAWLPGFPLHLLALNEIPGPDARMYLGAADEPQEKGGSCGRDLRRVRGVVQGELRWLPPPSASACPALT
eukprot:276712-Rhodomonas_salina.2